MENDGKIKRLELFEQNQALVTICLKNVLANFKKYEFDSLYDDLKQVGLIGLYNASMRFSFDKGTRFSTFAIPYIKYTMYNYLETVYRKRRTTDMQIISLETPIDDERTLADAIEYVSPDDVSWIFEDKRLTERMKCICKMLYEGYNQTEIAKEFNVSQPQISRLIKNIKNILKEDYYG